MIRERCSCGATFETDDSFAVNGRPDWESRGERMATAFRRDHRCVEPLHMATLESEPIQLPDDGGLLAAALREGYANGVKAAVAIIEAEKPKHSPADEWLIAEVLRLLDTP